MALFGVVLADRLHFARTAGVELGGDATLTKCRNDGCGALLGELLVVLMSSSGVRVTDDAKVSDVACVVGKQKGDVVDEDHRVVDEDRGVGLEVDVTVDLDVAVDNMDVRWVGFRFWFRHDDGRRFYGFWCCLDWSLGAATGERKHDREQSKVLLKHRVLQFREALASLLVVGTRRIFALRGRVYHVFRNA